MPVLVIASACCYRRSASARVVHFGVEPGEFAGTATGWQAPVGWTDGVCSVTASGRVCSPGSSSSGRRPVIEVPVVSSAGAGVARDGAYCLRVVVVGRSACSELRQCEVTRHIAVGWSEGNCSGGATKLEIGEHPAVVVSEFGYFIRSGGTATVVGDGTDGTGVAACEFWKGLALGWGDVLDWTVGCDRLRRTAAFLDTPILICMKRLTTSRTRDAEDITATGVSDTIANVAWLG